MTRERFIELLHSKRYAYKIEGDMIFVNSSPSGGGIHLDYSSIPPGVVFINKESVFLDNLISMPDNIVFNNGKDVHLRWCKNIPSSVKFNNGGKVLLKEKWFSNWSCNIEGINSTKLLNLMVSKGMFER